jgi:protein-arginine kinase
MERPFYPQETSANLSRDWPDARGVWVSQDKSISAQVNRKDHLLVSVVDSGNDLKATFTKFADFVKEV